MSPEEDLALDLEVETLLQKGAVKEVPFSSDLFISRLFTVPKKSGGLRPVINLRPLNRCLFVPKFKMEHLSLVQDLVRPGDFFCKIDLTDAYFSVAIHSTHQRFLSFAWKNRFYSFVCMAFGISTAPRIFSKILKVITSHLRRRGIRLICYLDDMLIIASDYERCRQDAKTATEFIAHVGFVTNLGKSILEPTQRIVFLGSGLDSVTMSLFLPNDKVIELSRLANAVLEKGRLTARELAHVIGKFQAAAVSVLLAPLHFRQLQLLLISTLRRTGRDWDALVHLPQDAQQDLVWWRDSLPQNYDRPIHCPVGDIVIESDASQLGWGAFSDGISTGGRWSVRERARHINQLEMMAATFAVQSFCKDKVNSAVRIKSDNSTVVAYINRRGGTKSSVLADLALNLWSFCVERGLLLSAVHVAGLDNVRADFKSRNFNRLTEWSVSPSVYEIILQICPALRNPRAVDLFASRLNRKLRLYVSWEPDPEAVGTDAFTLDWNQWEALYAFPPFILVGRVLTKIRQDKVQRVHLLAPIWETAAWYPMLLHMLVQEPVRLPTSRFLLTQPVDGTPHPLGESLRLAVWTVSGLDTESLKFRMELPECSWHPGDREPVGYTRPPGGDGLAGVVEKVLIPFRRH
ncbi:uncharacterized protein LOC144880269 [Branchiostoma floridae x Branchiostoma japonicum]